MNFFKKPKMENEECTKKVHAPSSGIDDSQLYDSKKIIGGLHWYKKQYYLAMKANIILGVCLIVSIIVIFGLIINRPKPIYFAATPDLRISELVPLYEPLLTEQGLLNWCTEIVTSAVSLDFLDWRKKLSVVRPNFSDAAFKSFLESLDSSGTLNMIKDKRLSVSSAITAAPVIVSSGLLDGKMTWRIEFPLVMSYESSQGVESTQNLMATVLVRRANTVKTPRGVAIHQIVLKRNS